MIKTVIKLFSTGCRRISSRGFFRISFTDWLEKNKHFSCILAVKVAQIFLTPYTMLQWIMVIKYTFYSIDQKFILYRADALVALRSYGLREGCSLRSRRITTVSCIILKKHNWKKNMCKTYWKAIYCLHSLNCDDKSFFLLCQFTTLLFE